MTAEPELERKKDDKSQGFESKLGEEIVIRVLASAVNSSDIRMEEDDTIQREKQKNREEEARRNRQSIEAHTPKKDTGIHGGQAIPENRGIQKKNGNSVFSLENNSMSMSFGKKLVTL